MPMYLLVLLQLLLRVPAHLGPWMTTATSSHDPQGNSVAFSHSTVLMMLPVPQSGPHPAVARSQTSARGATQRKPPAK
jgi:hypothetical protein